MTVDNGRVCCNCNHCKRTEDDAYGIVLVHCDAHHVYLSYADVMAGSCERWKPEERKDE